MSHKTKVKGKNRRKMKNFTGKCWINIILNKFNIKEQNPKTLSSKWFYKMATKKRLAFNHTFQQLHKFLLNKSKIKRNSLILNNWTLIMKKLHSKDNR
jgi:hypothetical protein